MHKATVMYIQRNMWPCLSFGSQLLERLTGKVYRVLESTKMLPYHQLVELELLYVAAPMPCMAIVRQIKWPSLGWKLVHLSGTQPKPVLNYVDQMIPSPMNLRVAKSWSKSDVLYWTAPTTGPKETLRRLSVDSYCESVIKRSQLLRVFSHFRFRSRRDARATEVGQLVNHNLHLNSSYEVKDIIYYVLV
jgi:hypothetical protein